MGGILSPEAHAENMNAVLAQVRRHRWSLSSFLKDLFSLSEDGFKASQKQVQMVSIVLGGHSVVGVNEIVEKMYVHGYSKPKAVHTSQNCPAREVIHEEGKNMAQGKI